MKEKNIVKHAISILVLAFLMILVYGSNDNEGSKTKKPSGTSSSKSWYEGGNLHNATVGQWKSATHRNKLATAADWLASTKWKGHLNSPRDFEKIKVKANMLVKAVNKVITVEGTDSMKVTEIAAAIVTMSNDLGP